MKYYSLITMSDDPVILPPDAMTKLVKVGMHSYAFLVQKESKLVDLTLSERPPKLPLNFVSNMALGVIQLDFLGQFLPFDECRKHVYFSKLLYSKGSKIIDDGFRFFKCKNVIYLRGKKTSIVKVNKKTKEVLYARDIPPEYVTHIPEDSIPIYGTQSGGSVILREDLMGTILQGKKNKYRIDKLKVMPPIDGWEFKDSLSV